MRITIRTEVSQSLEKVFSAFDRNLFLKLSPPFPPVKLLRFDGCSKNDEVHLELSFVFFRQKWVSVITENKMNDNLIYFIDKGKILPFFLKNWKHKHILERIKNGTLITDDIEFNTGSIISDVMVLPLMYIQFIYRKPVYKRYFAK